ncbi:MAG: MBL fold metallo-hydrolase [Gammaproteobacteria bacterium]|nr:MBL fold metallo-hydrolase [Gammaproteobacteria bacterium]RPG25495.1 MAG: MBL fold metallo-hydrolase [Gammaproteobacteria bacterium TMED50]
MRIASLGSGSHGNGTVIDDGDTRLLIDAGFSLKEITRRLKRIDLTPADITAVLVTHEHADHSHGVGPLVRKFKLPMYMTHGTHRALSPGLLPSLRLINPHQTFQIGKFVVEPVIVPHDAREPCQFVFHHGDDSLGVLTDLGHISSFVMDRFGACDGLLLECNHDLEMLRAGPYPGRLKRRVGGELGHLNNQQAAGLLNKADLNRLRLLVLSHLSEVNNRPDLARDAVTPALAGWQGQLVTAAQDQGFSWREV